MRGGGAEGGFWLLLASRPSPILVVGCRTRQCVQIGPGRGRWNHGGGGSPLRPLQSSLDWLESQTTKYCLLAVTYNGWINVWAQGQGGHVEMLSIPKALVSIVGVHL